jgi:hypothetical protein
MSHKQVKMFSINEWESFDVEPLSNGVVALHGHTAPQQRLLRTDAAEAQWLAACSWLRQLLASSMASDWCKPRWLSPRILVDVVGGRVVCKPLVCQAPIGTVWERHNVNGREGVGRLTQVRRHGSATAGQQ